MGKRRTRQTPHAEGAHGPVTHKKHIENLQAGPHEEPGEALWEQQQRHLRAERKSRLTAGRAQFDEAEKNSEITKRSVARVDRPARPRHGGMT